MERYAELYRGYVGRGVPSSLSYSLCSDVLCGYIGENINIEKGHNKGSRIRMMVRCSTIVDAPHFVLSASPHADTAARNYAVAF